MPSVYTIIIKVASMSRNRLNAYSLYLQQTTISALQKVSVTLLIFGSSFITFSLPYILVLSFPLPSSFLPSSFSYLILRSFFSFINRTCKPFNYTSTTNFAIRMNPLVKKEHSQHRHRENTQSRYLVSLIAVSSDTYKFF